VEVRSSKHIKLEVENDKITRHVLTKLIDGGNSKRTIERN